MTNRETEEKLRKLAAVDPALARAAWLTYLSGEQGEREQADDLTDVLLERVLGKDYRKAIFLEPPETFRCEGSYRLGSVVYPPGRAYAPFGLREDEWIKHVLITGMTGAGKTNLAFLILMVFREHGKPFLVFDWKRNYRDLGRLPGFEGVTVYTVARRANPFFFNPLIPPPGAEPGEWLMLLVDVIRHAYFVGEGVEYLLRSAIDWVYRRCGYLDGTPTHPPTFHMVRNFIVKLAVHGRMSLWKASTLRVVDALCFPHGLGPVVNAHESIGKGELLDRNVVIELDALADGDKTFLTEALILWVYQVRKAEGNRETFKHALVIEEGHHVLSAHKEVHEGAETIMETSLRQIREFGEAVIVIDQEPTKLSNSIKANTYAKITFALGNGKDVLDMATCMGLDEEERAYLNLLDVGAAIVSLKGRVFQPLLVEFPLADFGKGSVTRLKIGAH